MKTIARILVGMVLFLLIVFAGGIGKMIGKSTSERFLEGISMGRIDEALIQTASEINKTLPMMLDADIRLDSTVAAKREFRYNYTLVNYAAEELDPSALDQAMRPRIINQFCTAKEMKIFVENDVQVSYAYFGKNGKQITAIAVPASICRNDG